MRTRPHGLEPRLTVRRTRTRTAVGRTPFARLLVALALGALCACSTGGSSTAAEAPQVASPEPTTETAPPPPAALLTVDDLPEGWSEVPADVLSAAGDSCLDLLSAPGGPFDAGVAETVTFRAGGIGPFLVASVVEQPAGQVLPAVDAVLASCDEQSSESESESEATTAVEPVPVDDLPPDALAVRGSDTTAEGSGVHYLVAAAGTETATAMVFGVTPLGEVDEEVVGDALNAAYERLPGS